MILLEREQKTPPQFMDLKLRPPDGVIREQGYKAVDVVIRMSKGRRREAPSRTPGAGNAARISVCNGADQRWRHTERPQVAGRARPPSSTTRKTIPQFDCGRRHYTHDQ